MTNLGENRKGSVGVSRDCHIFRVPPIISGTGKATNVKFGRYLHRVHPNKIPLKIWEKRKLGLIRGLPKFFEYPFHLRNRQGKPIRFGFKRYTNFTFFTIIHRIGRNKTTKAH